MFPGGRIDKKLVKVWSHHPPYSFVPINFDRFETFSEPIFDNRKLFGIE